MQDIQKTVVPGQEPIDAVEFFTMGNSSFVTDGPLARAYEGALDQLYRKEVDPATGIVLEEEATPPEQPEEPVSSETRTLKFANAGDDVGMLYGVKHSQVSVQDNMRVVDAISRMSDTQKLASALVIDASSGAAGTPEGMVPMGDLDTSVQVPKLLPPAAALESYCRDHGVAVYHSFGEFLKRHGG